jgi:biopolymer transport protein ExbB/TolQ
MRRLKILKIYFIFWLFVFFMAYSNWEMGITFFMATLSFNIIIMTLLAIGTVIILTAAVKLVMLIGTFGTLAYKKGKALEFYLHGLDKVVPANVANMLEQRAKKGALYFTHSEAREIVDLLENKFSNTKTYINFFISTALMIGLLGTFTGLLQAIDQMGAIVLSLNGDINIGEVIASFAGPLSGMAVGFGSSLFGVIAAIILGFKGYILDRNQAAFIEDIEDWLKGKTIESHGVVKDDGTVVDSGDTSYIEKFVDKLGEMAKSFDNFEKSNEELGEILSTSIKTNVDKAQEERDMLENVLNVLKELNVNQYTMLSTMEKSFNEMLEVMFTMNNNIKKLSSNENN